MPSKSSVSRASSYREIGEYWDEHDLEDAWDPSRQVEFDVGMNAEHQARPDLCGKTEINEPDIAPRRRLQS